MRIKILSNVNSGQYDKGDIADFTDEEAMTLIDAGAAELLAEEAKQPAEPQSQLANSAPAEPQPTIPVSPAPEATLPTPTNDGTQPQNPSQPEVQQPTQQPSAADVIAAAQDFDGREGSQSGTETAPLQ